MSTVHRQKIHFVTGKGGVGKSFFAASLAKAFAHLKSDKDAPILLAELSSFSFYEDYLNIPHIGFKPTALASEKKSLDVALWSGNDCLKEYALHLLKIESLYKLFFQNPISKALIDVAPGLQELAILGKATSSPRKHGPELKYSQIVFDAFATGHFLTMFRAPNALANTIRFGPMGEQSRSIHEWICKPDFCEVHIVCLPEVLPATETVELFNTLKNEFGLTAKVYLNKSFSITQDSLKNEDTILQNYFSSILHEQTLAENILTKNKITFEKIPFITELDTTVLLQKAAEKIVKGLHGSN